jgi:hypothetical protein
MAVPLRSLEMIGKATLRDVASKAAANVTTEIVINIMTNLQSGSNTFSGTTAFEVLPTPFSPGLKSPFR